MTIVLAIGLGLLACLPPKSARASEAAAAFVERLNAAIDKAVAGSADLRETAKLLCENLSGSAFDLGAMMKTASAGAWERMNSSEREAYSAAFRLRIVRDCAKNAARYLPGNVELAGVRMLSTGEMIVGVRSQGPQAAKTILMWRMRPREAGAMMITDLLVEGRSALLSLREQSALSLEREPGNIAALIDSLGP